MLVLTINCGSSSLKTAIIDSRTGVASVRVKVERIGDAAPALCVGGEDPVPCEAPDHAAAFERAWSAILERFEGGFGGVGHRVVHGGERFTAPTLIDDDVVAGIEALSELAPLHNPKNLAGIRAARELLADLPHVAVFDTAFHATLPRRARSYALPHALADKHGIRRYGFHGPSHQYVARRAAEAMDADIRDLRIVTCHLGSGCSIAAVEMGRSVETSMGMTPLEGLVMGTRSGDVDPGVLLHLLRKEGAGTDALDAVLNKESGLAGMTQSSGDMRDIEERAAAGDDLARTALHVFSHRVRKYIGAYAAVMGGLDAVVFTAGIGQNSALVRHRVAQRLGFLGARIDEDRNRDCRVDGDTPVFDISEGNSRVKLLVIATDEERAIAEQTAHLVNRQDRVKQPRKIPIAVSARHIHLTDESVEALFGPGHTLTPRNPLSQPGQFACEETLKVIGPKRSIDGVRVLGPTRGKNQIEISRTDEFFLGVDAPVRQSGFVKDTPGVTLEGPAGTVHLDEGLICAWRHIHMTPDDAEHFGVKNRDVVEVEITGGPRDLTFGDVLVRVKDTYALEMHIDTDEANAAELNTGAEGLLEATAGEATLVRRVADYDPAP